MAVYERDKRIGGLAHIMLPGKSPSTTGSTKYAEDAIKALLDRTKKPGAEIADLEISIVGGANILREGDIPDKVIESVLGCLKRLHRGLKGMRVGGFERRSVFLDTTSGEVYYTEGENTTKTLLDKIERIKCSGRV